MFILTKIADLVQIAPADFSKRSKEAIEDNINAKYSNKVIQKIGLCICLYDLQWASEGLIGHGTGLVNVNVEFRMVVFRPFKGEVMMARISTSTPEGIHLQTDFFADIFVSYEYLPPGAEFSHSHQLWVWNVDEEQRLLYEMHEMVRFQVIDEEWHDQAPAGPKKQEETEATAPYRIKGSMIADGLGLCLWWD
ncbi:DNA-directed RNA polymerase III complex subunit Rpc25 [Fusarium solani]|uniref:DNA-directed RNA polymerase subunit n=1 Tax=Fusarium solani TaxID=169388 RepID=A0A9P9HKV8_FUSSL|nr:RNA polymerase III subunit Rpc25-domain-containing protein [Fusarium solani]KAH7258324.1 RNA polymerase III subunit Rpc25-domain-containing protein [Fusarium solani]KAJ4224907.1 DNA-directed RNA polymerase III complex subunit Rpc25 [Fusarium solani]